MRIDENTIEKSLLSTLKSLEMAYSVSKRVNATEARKMVCAFLKSNYNISNDFLADAIDSIYNEYENKKDMAFTGLSRLRELIL